MKPNNGVKLKFGRLEVSPRLAQKNLQKSLDGINHKKLTTSDSLDTEAYEFYISKDRNKES